ncbi:MAG: hypothetical protein KGR26_06790 [Cyanobacteria bacterium REEB65]|nr:hypothetical protein [Cyanobacteria bacterium REEB65]
MRALHGWIATTLVLAGCGTATALQPAKPHEGGFHVLAVGGESAITSPKQPVLPKAMPRPQAGTNPTGAQTAPGQQTGAQTAPMQPTGQGQTGKTGFPNKAQAGRVTPKTPAGGGAGPTDVDVSSPQFQQAMQSLNLSVIHQAAATSQLQEINPADVQLSETNITKGLGTGLAPEAMGILRAGLQDARFLNRDGMLIPFVLQGTQYVPLIVTVSGQQELAFFTQDCATGQLVGHTLVL